MAGTWEDAYRLVGVMLRGWVAKDFSVLDPTRLDETRARYEGLAVADIVDLSDFSTWQALDWFLSFMEEEAGLVPLVNRYNRAVGDTSRATTITVGQGPQRIEELLRKGVEPDDAYARALRSTIFAANDYLDYLSKQTLTMAVSQTNQQAHRVVLQGYKRAPRPGACAFCLMLAGAAERYVVFNATEAWRKPHINCQCDIIPVLGMTREVIYRSPQERALGRAMHNYIKAAKDRAKTRHAIRTSTIDTKPKAASTAADVEL